MPRMVQLLMVVMLLTPPSTPEGFDAAAAKVFNLTARSFTFDVNPSPFVVNSGDTVTLNISVPADDQSTAHGFFLEQYVNGLSIIRGQTVTVNFVANVPGTFTYFCTVFCGIGHGVMNGVFIVNAGAPPSITSFAPASGPTAGGTVVSITGTNFQNGATVKFGGAAAVTTVVNSATSITAVNPAHAAGGVAVVVTNPDGRAATSTTMFTYEAPNPAPKRRRAVRRSS